MTRFLTVATILLLFLNFSVSAQTVKVEGLRNNSPSVYAFTNAQIYLSPGSVIDNGTIIIRNGIIESVGSSPSVPPDAWIIDLEGKVVYPGFIEIWSESGFDDSSSPGFDAVHSNPQVRSWFTASGHYKHNSDAAARLRTSGFVVANAVPPAGIFRGETAVVSLSDHNSYQRVVKPGIAHAVSFDQTRSLGGGYPSSLMGVIALIRQTFYDAEWYESAQNAYLRNPSGLQRPEYNLGLENLRSAKNGNQPVIFDVRDEIALLRAENIAKEFGLNVWVRGSGYEYRRLDAVKSSGMPVIVPVNFPSAPQVAIPEDAMRVSLEALRHWDFAPENPGRLSNAGVPFVITSSRLTDRESFLDKLRVAVERGLDSNEALRALTVTPAKMLGIDSKYGTIERGKSASFVISDGCLFTTSSEVKEVWIDGESHVVGRQTEIDLRGTWTLYSDESFGIEMVLGGTPARLNGKVKFGTVEISLSNIAVDSERISFRFKTDELGIPGFARISAAISENQLNGIGENPDANFYNWTANRTAEHSDSSNNRQSATKSKMSIGKMVYPSMEFGLEKQPLQVPVVVVKNATIWTQSDNGIIENSDILIRNGLVSQIGKDISVPQGALVIDATGKHLTPGLVDPHLHSSIGGGVNETGNNMTPETRISDVIEPDNIWVYRLLAGGLTTANLLHGSANPVGGQDAVIKMRWGSLADDMLLEGAKPGLKLALGENVVRSTARYPNTRMGAEQIIKDIFEAAIYYRETWERYNRNPTGIPPRKDIQLDAIVEVLKGERIVHAHAYRQDEMQMLMRLAEEMGFKIASFEHTVEGYKIADILREHGAAAIVWTDWSSFKVESADAIIQNAKILLDRGVLTSLHSDDTQLSTRMNWEAGKAMQTGIDDINAMNMITINPAKILGVDHLVGSLEPGKHADFVIWSGHPLSGFTHAEQTWIDGRKYFDRSDDLKSREQVLLERAALIQKILGYAAESTPEAESTPASEQ